jgi:hypothetical protein
MLITRPGYKYPAIPLRLEGPQLIHKNISAMTLHQESSQKAIRPCSSISIKPGGPMIEEREKEHHPCGMGPISGLASTLSSLMNQRIFFRMQNRIELRINIQGRPIKMMGMKKPYVDYISYSCFIEPGKGLKRQEMLMSINRKPEAKL